MKEQNSVWRLEVFLIHQGTDNTKPMVHKIISCRGFVFYLKSGAIW